METTTRPRYTLTARTAPEMARLGRVEDALANHTVKCPDLADALDLAALVARTLNRPAYVTLAGPWPGETPAPLVTSYETADHLARVMPDGLITTRPDGRTEYLPACPVGTSNPNPRGRVHL